MIKLGHDRSWICHLRAETYKSRTDPFRKSRLKPSVFLDALVEMISSVNLGVKNYV